MRRLLPAASARIPLHGDCVSQSIFIFPFFFEQGDYRRRMRECVRATTAAPSYFTPLIDGPMMYADGAFMANNPTSIALTEVSRVAC